MKPDKINFSYTLIFAIFLTFLGFKCKKIEPVLAFTKYVNAEFRIVNTSNGVAAKIERTVSKFNIFTANGEHASKYASNLDKQTVITDKACKKYNIYSAKLFLLIKSGNTPDEAIEKISSNAYYKEYEYDNTINELSFPIKDTIDNKEVTLQATINILDILQYNKETNKTERLESVILKEESHTPTNKDIVDIPPPVLPIDVKPKAKPKSKPVKPKEEKEVSKSDENVAFDNEEIPNRLKRDQLTNEHLQPNRRSRRSNGHLTIYTSFEDVAKIRVWVDGKFMGNLTRFYRYGTVSCGAHDAVNCIVSPGWHHIEARGVLGVKQWDFEIFVEEGDCNVQCLGR